MLNSSTQNILDVADQASGNAPLTDGFQVGDEGVGGTVEGHGRSPIALSQASPADSQFQGITVERLVDAVFRAEERAAEIERVQK